MPPRQNRGVPTHLPCGLDAFPDTEETDEPDKEETERQVPLQGAHIFDAGGQAEHIATANKPAEVRMRQGWGWVGGGESSHHQELLTSPPSLLDFGARFQHCPNFK